MHAEWMAECGPEDPVVVVPWASPDDPELHFVDLRENPYDLDRISEAEQHPPIMQALRALNAARSPVFTAKCDAWAMDAEELASLQYTLDLQPEEAAYGFMSYIDLLWRERAISVSFHQQEQRMTRLERMLEPLDQPYAAVECVLRPALVDLPEHTPRVHEGFSISLYVKALGTDAPHAQENWASALGLVVPVLRGKDFLV